jgi:hypothetical protein
LIGAVQRSILHMLFYDVCSTAQTGPIRRRVASGSRAML